MTPDAFTSLRLRAEWLATWGREIFDRYWTDLTEAERKALAGERDRLLSIAARADHDGTASR